MAIPVIPVSECTVWVITVAVVAVAVMAISVVTVIAGLKLGSKTQSDNCRQDSNTPLQFDSFDSGLIRVFNFHASGLAPRIFFLSFPYYD